MFIALFASLALASTPELFDQGIEKFRGTLKDMVAADTTNPPGNERRIAELVVARLKAEGIPSEIVEFAPGRANLVARLKGGDPKGILLLAHEDVVGTENQDWSSLPHVVTEKDGYLVGRGVGDDLGMAAMSLETFILIHKSGRPLKRDLVLALTGDEESDGAGVQWLLKNRPDLLMSSIAINEGGGIVLDQETGRVKFLSLQVAEKFYQDIEVTARGTTGHSSVPLPDNAIYRLSRALAHFDKQKSLPNLQPLIKSYLKERAKVEPAKVARAMLSLAGNSKPPASALAVMESDPILSATIRTTCVATMLSGGTRVNALPAEAKANINCRVLPGTTKEQVEKFIRDGLGDPKLEIRFLNEFAPTFESPLEGAGPQAITKIAREMWPGVPVIPVMAKGATDSKFLREKGIAAYGMNPIALTETDGRRMHGIDERIPVSSLRPGIEFYYRLVSELVF
ncbi:MAG: M20/M25/M40 family metallo-hydrolase [Deltaproteobacteria bacterium]|nr:M20/M25/M40 family metallo-hydrolase [Deltaproteobacteria bacterium]MBI3294925.1 M20/M25/M40 family metallo-hydrolase [Deltaproteobacteria bacterium]